MGYTHYWYKNCNADDKLFREKYAELYPFVDKIIQNGNVHLEATLEPSEKFYFNGVSNNGHETFVWVAGKGSGFFIKMPTSKMEETDANFSEGAFSFCKTARKPYDVIVVATLCAIQHIYGKDLVHISSDGDMETDWAEGRALFERVLSMEDIRINKQSKLLAVAELVASGGALMQKELSTIAGEYEARREEVASKKLVHLTEDDTSNFLTSFETSSDPNTLLVMAGSDRGINMYAPPATSYLFTEETIESVDLETIALLNEQSLKVRNEPQRLTFVVSENHLDKYRTEPKYALQETSVSLTQQGAAVWQGTFQGTQLIPNTSFVELNLASDVAVAVSSQGIVSVSRLGTRIGIHCEQAIGTKGVQLELGEEKYVLTCVHKTKTLPRAALCQPQQDRLKGVRQYVLGVPWGGVVAPKGVRKISRGVRTGPMCAVMCTMERPEVKSAHIHTMRRTAVGVLKRLI